MVDLDFRFGDEMRSHRLPMTLTGARRRPAVRRRRWFRLPRGCSVRLAHLMGMNTQELGLEPLIGVEELASTSASPCRPSTTGGCPDGRREPSSPLTAELLDQAFARTDDE